MTKSYDVLIVGAGHGGAGAAIALRQQKFVGKVALIGEEPEIPYDRPSLSKDYFEEKKTFERLLLRPATFWKQSEIDILSSCNVVAVDAASHLVSMSNGDTLGYGKLIWSTGGRPRTLTCPGHDLRGVYSVRSRRDIDKIKDDLESVERVVVIGGGYLGLEMASVLVAKGKHVTVVEALDRVLARVAGEALSRFMEKEHRANGVDIRLNTAVDEIEGEEGRVTGVRVTGNEIIRADLVIVGIGIIPAVEPLLAAGAVGGNGVVVDEFYRTTLTDIWAIGDCALCENRYANGQMVRLESVQNAVESASTAARAIIGKFEATKAVPQFWSSQYDLHLQTVGLSIGYDDFVVRGDLSRRSFSVIYLRESRVIALDCINAVKDFVQGKHLILGHSMPNRLDLADTQIPLFVRKDP